MLNHRTRVVLTGGSGFIGRRLAAWLDAAGYEVHHLARRPFDGAPGEIHVCTFADENRVARTLARINPRFVLHLAARAIPGRDLAELAPQWRDTVIPALVLAQAIPASVELAAFFGSCEEYGNGPAPFREEQAARPFSPYGWAKVAAHEGVAMIARQRALRWCWLRPFLAYGPGQVSTALIPSLMRGFLEGQDVPLSAGGQTRDFVFIDDLCRMVERVLGEPGKVAGGETLNLCSGKARSVKSVAEAVRRACGGPGKALLGALPYRENEAMEFVGDPTRFRALFGDAERTDFEAGLRLTVQAARKARELPSAA